ncbi:MAG: SUMF1/EgtB/PvdO family nonheme iron enzyme [Chitinophagales bacterium]
MKTNPFLLIALILISLLLLNFTLPEKNFKPIGTVQVNDSLYFEETEVSNRDWKAYETWNKQMHGDASAAHISALPDTTVWKKEINDYDEYVNGYYNKIKFINCPVVGISWEQANAYCKWKTESANRELAEKPIELNYRLPTVAEWKLAAKAGYSQKLQKTIDKKGYPFNKLHNIVVYDSTYKGLNKEEVNPNASITAPVDMYFPNKYGIFNLFGNVAEMTAEEGVAKGGSWNHTEEEVALEKHQSYEKATAWLGFRCICEVKWNTSQ